MASELDFPYDGWTAGTFASPDEWRLPYIDDHARLADQLRDRLGRGPGFAVVTDTPIAGLTLKSAREFGPDMLGRLGEPLPQMPGQTDVLGWLVRDEGFSRYDSDGFQQGIYTSKTHDCLDIHNDSAMHPNGTDFDVFALFAHRRARSGGESILVSTATVYRILSQEYPAAFRRLHEPFAFERTHVTPPGEPPVSWGPVFQRVDGGLRVRWNRQRIEMAQAVTGTPLPPPDVAALDAFDEVVSRPGVAVQHLLEAGECLVVDDHKVLHGRTAFIDHDEADRRRCLVRVLLRTAF